MMIERHYDDEALIALLGSNRVAADTHLPSCAPCSGRIESYQMISEALRDGDVWDTRQVRSEAIPSTIATLRAFADRMTHEDTQAEATLKELLTGPRETWMANLQAHPEWRTAGVVRKLIAAAYGAVMTMPPDAVEITTLATTIADELDSSNHPRDTVARLRGAAYREQAYALYYTGRFSDAELAIFAAERHFCSCSIEEYEIARLGIVKTLVSRAFERLPEAESAASASARRFTDFGDLSRMASAKLAQAQVLFSRGNYAEAEPLLSSLERQLAETEDLDTHARVLANLAYCARRMGKTELSISRYETASVILGHLGADTEVVRIRWSIAAMLAQAGRLTDAYRKLQELSPEMERLGMTSEAALNALEIAELLLADERFAEVEQICRTAMASFERAGLSSTARALTALAYITEAAQQRTAKPILIKTVREYIRRLPAQPNLLFAPPP